VAGFTVVKGLLATRIDPLSSWISFPNQGQVQDTRLAELDVVLDKTVPIEALDLLPRTKTDGVVRRVTVRKNCLEILLGISKGLVLCVAQYDEGTTTDVA